MNEFFGSYNPRNSALLGTFPVCSAQSVACAVASARNRQTSWGEQTAAARIIALRRLRDNLARDADALAAVVAEEIGKPLQEAYAADVMTLIGGLDWLTSRLSLLLAPRSIPGERRAQSLAMPFGVIGIIGTWNYPLLLDGTSLAWALAAGNAVVWKPSELATVSATRLHTHLERAGLPVELVTGDGGTGQALCETPAERIDKLAFTGSVSTGRAILAQLSAQGIPSVMELSGNDAMIVCADADLAGAAKAAVWARVCNAGQSCVSPQRMYVAQEVYAPFLAACEKIMNGLRADIDYGPMRVENFRKRAHGLVVDAARRGARLMTGGDCLRAGEFSDGFYYAPTLLADCRDDMPIMREDFFGPVLCVRSVRDVEEAITLANANPMGLGASIWTRDVGKGRKVSTCVKAGVITINMETLMTGAHPGLPFGGMGASGWGRQRGAAGLDEFVQWKTVCWQKHVGAHRHVFPYLPETMPILRGFLALKTAHGAKAKLQAARELGTPSAIGTAETIDLSRAANKGDSMRPEMQTEVNRLKTILEANAREFPASEPATLYALTAYERKMGLRLDEDLRDLYLLSNGSNGQEWFVATTDQELGFSFVSLEELMGVWPEGFVVGEPDMEAEEYADVDARIQGGYLEHPGWVPIGDFANGNAMIFFDTAPAQQGHYGQVTAFQHDPDMMYYIADNFLEFFKRSNNRLEELGAEFFA